MCRIAASIRLRRCGAARANRPHFPWALALVVLLTVFAIAPLTYPGFFQAHSGFWPVFNAGHLSVAPNWGLAPEQFDPVRDEGRLPYLFVRPVLELGASAAQAIKWGYGLAFILAAVGMYAWTCGSLGTEGALVAATAYTYLPWHLSTVYVRGAYAEAWLWAFWPLSLWAIDRLAERRPRAIGACRALGAGLISLGALAAAFWTQVGLTVFFCAVLAAYGVMRLAARSVRPRRPVWVGAALGAAALVTGLSWLVGRSALQARADPLNHLLYPFQLFSAAWGFGVSVPGPRDGMSFQLGLAAVGLGIVALALWARKRPSQARGKEGAQRHPSSSQDPRLSLRLGLLFWLAVLVVFVLLTWQPSGLLWEVTGLGRFLNYPWQLLGLVGLPLAFLAGLAVRMDERLAALPALGGVVALVVLASYPYLSPRFTQVDPGTEPVAMFQPLGEDRPQMMILDYELEVPSDENPGLAITLIWQTSEPVAHDYTVFVHLLAADDSKVAQVDVRPCGGECPTTTWQPGEIIVDRYALDLPADTPTGPYHGWRLAVGLYRLETGERSAVVGRDDGTVFFDVP